MLKMVILLLFLIVGCGPQFKLVEGDGFYSLSSAEKNSCYYNLDSKGRLISWPPGTEIVFYIESRVPAEFRSIIERAVEMWKPANIQISEQVVEASGSQLDRRNIIYWITDFSALSKDQQATTVTRWTQNKIIDSDILINASHFEFFDQPPALGSKIHFESLILHELGHALGMRHIPKPDSLMFFSLNYLQVRNSVSEIDLQSLGCVYK